MRPPYAELALTGGAGCEYDEGDDEGIEKESGDWEAMGGIEAVGVVGEPGASRERLVGVELMAVAGGVASRGSLFGAAGVDCAANGAGWSGSEVVV